MLKVHNSTTSTNAHYSPRTNHRKRLLINNARPLFRGVRLQGALEGDVAVLPPGSGDLLGAQDLQVLAQALTGAGGVDDVVHEASLRGHHRVGEPAIIYAV
jgi:hypothetical protein